MPRLIANIDDVKRAVELLHTDLIEIGSFITNDIFTYLGWNAIERVQNKDVIYLFNANESIASQYQPGKFLNATLGEVFTRELQVKNVASNLIENLQEYREEVPFDILGISENGALNTPNIERKLRMAMERFASQIYRNLVAGDYSKGVGDPYGLTDGVNTLIKKEITAGAMTTGKGNLQYLETIDFTDRSDENKVHAFEQLMNYLYFLDEDLADADRVNHMIDRRFLELATEGASLKFSNAQEKIITGELGITQFYNHMNHSFLPTKVMGRGQQIISYTPGNITYGTDLARTDGVESAKIEVNLLDARDPNLIDIFMQVAIGMRINQVNAENFCVALSKDTEGADVYNTFKTLKGTITVDENKTPFDISNLTAAQIEALKTQLGIA